MKILTVVGARPQFVKAAVVSRAINETPELSEVIVHTGQHFDDNMSTIFFDELGIPHPKYNLGVGGMSHASNTGKMMEGIEQKILDEKPDFVLVFGDTDSTLAGSLAAAKLGVKVAHVEAGLRSFNRAMPEEINRILTDHISSILFAPSEIAMTHLATEGIKGEMVQNVGDVMYDAIRLFNPIAEAKSKVMERLSLDTGGYALCTLHRKENTDNSDRLKAIIDGLGQVDLRIVLPLHPRTKMILKKTDATLPSNISIIEPVGYLDMITLQRYAGVIGTDSGGIQKEAYFQKVPCVTFRDETEWTELVDLGVNILAGADAALIAQSMNNARSIEQITEVYGAGDASNQITQRLVGEGNRG
ncbi:non-hydrolyzing UDP-N-acetylglucosamine 2-epimerase [Parasphingorhabdus halotolerans]|uniref:UDP-N-acetylglucosamine 2-epimerase (Non-hydrolyzing) n=1 Tax=Parasphingorhabdus halotolerans TaxID=2725558 RepID=A0A6H2DP44_9SPHN|nr:UDP-N-acetylglucosamine 2-epimerase (non-hydrolyzing) [Parasphingorhabdus halotolerans]QJB69753.1 UDP-N-acetylglucosamine 2-epimerase (non-hydrolyzing) [Parasphingorhabdus halotolerans]